MVESKESSNELAMERIKAKYGVDEGDPIFAVLEVLNDRLSATPLATDKKVLAEGFQTVSAIEFAFGRTERSLEVGKRLIIGALAIQLLCALLAIMILVRSSTGGDSRVQVVEKSDHVEVKVRMNKLPRATYSDGSTVVLEYDLK